MRSLRPGAAGPWRAAPINCSMGVDCANAVERVSRTRAAIFMDAASIHRRQPSFAAENPRRVGQCRTHSRDRRGNGGDAEKHGQRLHHRERIAGLHSDQQRAEQSRQTGGGRDADRRPMSEGIITERYTRRAMS